jgi:starch synthase
MAPATASPAIFFKADEFNPYKRMMGRQVASNAFLKAVARSEPASELAIYASDRNEVPAFEKVQKEMGAPARRYRWLRAGDLGGLANAGLLYRPDPVLHEEAWMRKSGDTRAFSLCGVTHTLSSTGAQRAMTQFLVAPYEEWDAVICTSHAVRKVIDGITEEYGGYLAERFGAPVPPKPVHQLPVIPLGVHTDEFDTTTPEMKRARRKWRQQLRIRDNDFVVLFIGRLAFHAKANPYPMYVALEQAAKRTGKKIHLVQVGWFGTDFIERAFKDTPRILCPSVSCHFLDGRDPKVRKDIWAVGDIFSSLVDNIQETFGLSPVEAMAAGLPVVAADWDGYRETVRDGVDGFLIPTLMTPAGFGDAMAHRHLSGIDTYDMYIAAAALNVAVDAGRAADAYTDLIQNPDLRQRMADAGRQRARDTFEWSRVYGQYRELWGELTERRRTATQRHARKPGLSINPSHPDPFRLFAHYTTRTFGGRAVITNVDNRPVEEWRRILALPLLTTGNAVMLDADGIAAVHAAISEKGGTIMVNDLLVAMGKGRREHTIRSISWLAKAGLVEVSETILVRDRPDPLP